MKNQMIKITQNFKLLFPWAFFKIQNIKGKKKRLPKKLMTTLPLPGMSDQNFQSLQQYSCLFAKK
jgi:hypothetical protein